MERMIALLWHNMFGRDRMYNLKLNAVLNTGRMLVLCARSDTEDGNYKSARTSRIEYIKRPLVPF